MKTAIYLTFNGNCRQAFAFYQKVFGVKLDWSMTNGESPIKDQIPEDQHDKIMHMSLKIKGDMHLMGSDYNPAMMQKKLVEGTNYEIALMPDSRQEADDLYQALLGEGGTADHPMKDMFWQSYWGSLTDPFGIQWMLDFQPPPLKTLLTESSAELANLAQTLKTAADNLPEASEPPASKKAKTDG